MEDNASTVDMASPSDGRFGSLRILCFGDSLTAGYSSYGYSHYPYAAQIRQELKKAFPAAEAQVVVSGLSGDRVVEGQFLQRMKGMCATDDYPPYDWIIVLGGTNDLGWSEPPHKVFQGLKDVWSVALETGANVMALSVLEAEHTGGDLIQRRNALNEMIAQHSQHRWHYMDLCAAVPYFNMSDAQKPRIWDDGLHLTMAGYEMMGEAIAAKLIELLHVVNQPINHGKQMK
ncbi:MAG: hypothetical protein L6R36_004682 [Xanthoria steineri]|nr:MAG: hypothetical protein L6R36_004682 [Xanthoria steineri]